MGHSGPEIYGGFEYSIVPFGVEARINRSRARCKSPAHFVESNLSILARKFTQCSRMCNARDIAPQHQRVFEVCFERYHHDDRDRDI